MLKVEEPTGKAYERSVYGNSIQNRSESGRYGGQEEVYYSNLRVKRWGQNNGRVKRERNQYMRHI